MFLVAVVDCKAVRMMPSITGIPDCNSITLTSGGCPCRTAHLKGVHSLLSLAVASPPARNNT